MAVGAEVALVVVELRWPAVEAAEISGEAEFAGKGVVHVV